MEVELDVFVCVDGVQSTPLLTKSFSQCIMRASVVKVLGTNDWPRLARLSIQSVTALLDLELCSGLLCSMW